MRYDDEHKQQTRIKVLDAAAKAIRRDGPDRVGVASMMADAGLTHGGFYAHFGSKDALITAAIAHMFEQARARFGRETQDRQPADALAHYIDFYLSKKHRDLRELGCPIAALSSDLPRLPAEAVACYAQGVRALTERFQGLIAQLPNPPTSTDMDSQQVARSLVAELVGALALSRVEPDAKRSAAILNDSKLAVKQRLGLSK